MSDQIEAPKIEWWQHMVWKGRASDDMLAHAHPLADHGPLGNSHDALCGKRREQSKLLNTPEALAAVHTCVDCERAFRRLTGLSQATVLANADVPEE